MSKNESNEEMSLTRVEAPSDGLFSIALTLLVLDIKVPHLAEDYFRLFNFNRE